MKITWIQPYYDILLNSVPLDTESLIDVGSGYGVFGYILSKARDIKRLISIEPFDYSTDHYNEHHKMTWQEYYKTDPDLVDVIVSTEMIEHMKKDDALLFLDQAKKKANTVIIATPYKYEEQSPYDGNKFQVHQSLITPDDFLKHGYAVSFMGSGNFPPRFKLLKKIYHGKSKGIINKMGITNVSILNNRFFFPLKLKKFYGLMGIKPSNIIGIWTR